MFKQNKICCISDIHLGVHQNLSQWHDIAIEWARWLTGELNQKKIKDIFISGDFFHYRSEIAVNTLHVANTILKMWKDFNIVILIGNHDSFYKDRIDINSLCLLNNFQNITVIDKHTCIKKFQRKIQFCPWATTISEMSKSDIIFGHFEIESFKLNHTKVCSFGLRTRDLLNLSDLIITGHFHTRELREYKKGKILYLGNPYQMDFGDTDNQKGYYTLDISNKKIEFFENIISPVHKKITLSSLIEYKKINDDVKKLFNNNIIKFIIDMKISSDDIDRLFTRISELSPQTLLTDYTINFDRFGLDDNETSKISGVDIPTAIDDFIDLLEIDNKKQVLDKTLQLYKNCK